MKAARTEAGDAFVKAERNRRNVQEPMKRYPPSIGQEPYGRIIHALARLVTLPQTNTQFDADVLPRDPVMMEVTRIRHALDDLMKFVPKVDPAALAARVAPPPSPLDSHQEQK